MHIYNDFHVSRMISSKLLCESSHQGLSQRHGHPAGYSQCPPGKGNHFLVYQNRGVDPQDVPGFPYWIMDLMYKRPLTPPRVIQT